MTNEFKNHEIVFDDVFAPSTSEVQTTDPELPKDPAYRLLAYNDHLHDVMEAILAVAYSMGLPRLPYTELMFVRLSDDDHADLLRKVRGQIDRFDEGTHEWLVTHCYLQYVEANHLASIDASPRIIANAMFKVGAACREFELNLTNKQHATRGRGTLASASDGGAEKKRRARSEHQERDALMDTYVAKYNSQTRAAIRLKKDLNLKEKPGSIIRAWRRRRNA